MGGRPSGAAKGSNGCSPLGPKKTGPKSQPGVFLAQPPSQNFQIPPAFAMVGHTLDSPPETFVVLESIAFNPWRTHEANDESAIFDGYQSEVAGLDKIPRREVPPRRPHFHEGCVGRIRRERLPPLVVARALTWDNPGYLAVQKWRILPSRH